MNRRMQYFISLMKFHISTSAEGTSADHRLLNLAAERGRQFREALEKSKKTNKTREPQKKSDPPVN